MYWIVVIFVIKFLLFLVWASADIESNVYLKTICRGYRKDKVVSITFDDGPDKFMTPKVLDILGLYGIKATFFLVGDKVQACPDVVERILAEGHAIGNHTYSHSIFFPLSSAKSVAKELEGCNDSIKETINISPQLFRPPFGVTNPIIGKAVRRLGFKTIGWSIRSLDTLNKLTREQICDRVISRLHPGAIILLHDTCPEADTLIEKIILSAKSKQYNFISIEEMIRK